MWVLEGESRLEEPGKQEIARELRLLFEGEIESLVLARDDDEGASRVRTVLAIGGLWFLLRAALGLDS